MNHHDLYFIRHAESQLNQAYYNYLVDKDVPHKWSVLCQRPDFLDQVKYNHDFIDCSITQKGIQQCQNARQFTDKLDLDLILVSPLYRTLQTCDILFGDRNIPIIVEPLLSQALRSSCDISKDIMQKIEKYSHYKFSNELIQDDLWFIKNQCKDHQQIYMQVIKDIDPQNHSLKCDKILEHMKTTLLYESPTLLRERAQRIKQMIKQYKGKYNKIGIVAHFCTINYIVSQHFTENNEPIEIHIKNCQVYPTNLKALFGQ